MLVAYNVMLIEPDKTVVCVVIGEIFQGPAKFIWLCVQMTLVFLIVGVYGLFWVHIKLSGRDNIAQKCMKSLSVLMVILVCGWMISTLSRLLSLFFIHDDTLLLYVLLYSGIATNIGCSANYYVFFWLSYEYRTAFKSQIRYIFKGSSNAVTNIGTVPSLLA
uniref:G_PROTEIN_RECEP_F1_2 domain-containing protein n=1 Tax=Acrobeloides nanus TaxID=290746 RepID=A0A914EGB9_9BILA